MENDVFIRVSAQEPLNFKAVFLDFKRPSVYGGSFVWVLNWVIFCILATLWIIAETTELHARCFFSKLKVLKQNTINSFSVISANFTLFSWASWNVTRVYVHGVITRDAGPAPNATWTKGGRNELFNLILVWQK